MIRLSRLSEGALTGSLRLGLVVALLFSPLAALSNSPSFDWTHEEGVSQQTEQKTPTLQQVLSPEQLLRQVAEMSVTADPWERTFLLEELADAALGINTKLGAELGKELFQASLQVPVAWYNYRHAAQMNAVRFVAAAGEIDAALELYERMEPPAHISKKDEAHEDLRELALVTLLPKLLALDREQWLTWATQRVRELAATPPYPYQAAQVVIGELLSQRLSEAEGLYAEAVSGFDKERDMPLARQHFVDFILHFEGKFRPDLERKAIKKAIAAILTAPPQRDRVWRIRLTLEDKGVVSLNSNDDRLLFRLLPILWTYDEEQAQEILHDRAYLRPALEKGGAVVSQQSVLVIGEHEDGAAKLDMLGAKRLAWQQGQKIAEGAARNPEEAVKSATAIDDPAARVAALAAIAANIAEQEPSRSRALLSDAMSLLEKLESPAERLRALTVILRAYVRLKDSERVARTYGEILQLGEELLEQETASDPQVPLAVTSSYQRLAEATRSVGAFKPEDRLAELKQIRNQVLQWHLIIELARALSTASRG